MLISGDLYDRAVPSPEAVQCATRILGRIRAAGISIVAISGNHDSAPRLGAFADFLAAGGLHLRTAAGARGRAGAARPTRTGPVAFYPVPYLEPDLARGIVGSAGPGQPPAGADQGAGDGARRPRRPTAGTRSVVLAHAFVVGATAGGSERSIAVGGVESVTADVFDGFDYVALGHLHGAQTGHRADPVFRIAAAVCLLRGRSAEERLAGRPRRRRRDRRRSSIDLPVVRRLATVRGTLAEILRTRAATDLADAYLSVELTDPVRPLEPMRRLRERFPHTLVAQWVPEPATSVRRRARPRREPVIAPTTVAAHRLRRATRGAPTPAPGERALLHEALAADRLVERVR